MVLFSGTVQLLLLGLLLLLCIGWSMFIFSAVEMKRLPVTLEAVILLVRSTLSSHNVSVR